MNEVSQWGTKRQFTPGSRFEFIGETSFSSLMGGSGSGGGDAREPSFWAAFRPRQRCRRWARRDRHQRRHRGVQEELGRGDNIRKWTEIFPGSSSSPTARPQLRLLATASRKRYWGQARPEHRPEGLLSDMGLSKLLPHAGALSARWADQRFVALTYGSVNSVTYGGPKLTIDWRNLRTQGRQTGKLLGVLSPPSPRRRWRRSHARRFGLTEKQAKAVRIAKT